MLNNSTVVAAGIARKQNECTEIQCVVLECLLNVQKTAKQFVHVWQIPGQKQTKHRGKAYLWSSESHLDAISSVTPPATPILKRHRIFKPTITP